MLDAVNINKPPHYNYRITKCTSNSAHLAPEVGKAFTQEQVFALNHWLGALGFSVIVTRTNSIMAIETRGSSSAQDVPDGSKLRKLEREAVKEQARQQEKARVDQERAAEYAALPSSSWIARTMGTDFANEFNRLALARVLDGKTQKFEGLMSGQWASPLQALQIEITPTKTTTELALEIREKYCSDAMMTF